MSEKIGGEQRIKEQKRKMFLSKQKEIGKILRLRQICKRGNQDLKEIAALFTKLPLLMSKYEICNNLWYSNQFIFYQKENNQKAQLYKMHLFDKKEQWTSLEISTIAKGSILHQIDENSCVISGGWHQLQNFDIFRNNKFEKTYSLNNHSYHALCKKKNDIFLFTGYSQECTPFNLQPNCEIFNCQTGYFKPLMSIPFPVESSGSGFIGNQIYLFGGGNGQHDIPNIQKFDPMLNKWNFQDDQSRLRLPVPSNIRASYDFTKIFAFGNSRYAQLKQTLLFDERNLFPHGEGYKGQVTTNNPILIYDFIFSVDTIIYAYDIKTGKWIQNWAAV